MEVGLFEDLKDSIRGAGAILLGERAAARRTPFGDPGDSESNSSGHPTDLEGPDNGE